MTGSFEKLLDEVGPRLERAFLARYGSELVPDLMAEVVAWAWEHRVEVEDLANPAGYLYRVGQSKARRLTRWRRSSVVLPPEEPARGDSPQFEPALDQALKELNQEQRTAVVLVHCFGWTQPEAAALLGVELHTVRNCVHRGMAALKASLGVEES